MLKNKASIEAPDFDARLFWDFYFDKIDWQSSYKTIIARIIERGDKQDWHELERYYGKDKVIKTIKTEILYLPDYAIDDVCKLYSLQKKDLLCYTRKQSRPGHWL